MFDKLFGKHRGQQVSGASARSKELVRLAHKLADDEQFRRQFLHILFAHDARLYKQLRDFLLNYVDQPIRRNEVLPLLLWLMDLIDEPGLLIWPPGIVNK